MAKRAASKPKTLRAIRAIPLTDEQKIERIQQHNKKKSEKIAKLKHDDPEAYRQWRDKDNVNQRKWATKKAAS